MPVRVRLEYVPRNISTPQTHLDLVDQSPSTVVLLHSLGISTTSPRVTQFTSWTTKITADRATRKCLKHRPSHHLSFLPPSHYNLTSDKTCLYTATMPPPPRPLGGGVSKSCRRTRRRALGSPWDRQVHPHTLTTTTSHTRTNIQNVNRTVGLVNIATEIGGAPLQQHL